MTAAEVRQAVFDAIRKIAPDADPTRLGPGADFRRSLDLDSFDVLQIVIALHERLRVEIPEADVGRLATVESLVDYLQARMRS
jgi:acyl carrier protein